ncbi:uncharacterized protein LOC135849930 [Planococcus citri]|uniref:uncharacterized protein LOC135849930 n=1 Tax=Planococcus citri TaxID=170843 RepID=UPI0031F8BFEB
MADESLLLPYDPEVDSFGSRTLRTESGEEITYEDAFKIDNFVSRALRVNTDVPKEFTMFVLRKLAVSRDTFRGFEASLTNPLRAYLSELIKNCGIKTTKRDDVHKWEETGALPLPRPSCFRGTFVKIFCKKVICNWIGEQDKLYDDLTTIFPFQVSKRIRLFSDIHILDHLEEHATFYPEIQKFLDIHFRKLELKANSICSLFLHHIRTFMADHLSPKSLLYRLENPQDVTVVDYLSDFPRLNKDGIEWFEHLYREFDGVKAAYRIDVSRFYNGIKFKYDDWYFSHLPETNFADLYSFFDYDIALHCNPMLYTKRFKQYLFFFIHALLAGSSRKFFIDDMLFECIQSLKGYKTDPADISMKQYLAKITLLHYRLKFHIGKSPGQYFIKNEVLREIKRYLKKEVLKKEKKPQMNVTYKSDLGLTTWMAFRTDENCFNVAYSTSKEIKNFAERLLCCVLCPKKDPVKFLVYYNAYLGVEVKYEITQQAVENLKNFVRLCNNCNEYDSENKTDEQELDCNEYDSENETDEQEPDCNEYDSEDKTDEQELDCNEYDSDSENETDEQDEQDELNCISRIINRYCT